MGMTYKELTDEQIIQVEALAAVLNAKQIADFFGIHRGTFYGLLKRHPEIERRYRMGKAKSDLFVANTLMAQIRANDVRATMFYLRTQCGWSEKMTLEANINHNHVMVVPKIDREEIENWEKAAIEGQSELIANT